MHGQRAALTAAVRAATVPLSIPSTSVKGTGFFVTPDLVLTCAHVVTMSGKPVDVVHGSATATRAAQDFEVLGDYYLPGGADGLDIALLRPLAPDPSPHVYLAAPVAPGDELWVFGYPEGKYRAGDEVSLRLDGISERVEGPILLKGTHGRIKPGMSGAPVLNWRTGAVCGVVRYRDGSHDDTARFVPIGTALTAYPGLTEANSSMPAAWSWLEMLDDAQLAAAGAHFPGPRLRRYLAAASAADDSHPYAAMLEARSPLSKVYLRQKATREPQGEPAGTEERIEADSLLQSVRGAQVVGGPGAGKSSLARHLTAVSARKWLAEGAGNVVPILITAEALTLRLGLSEMLAAGVVRSLDTDLDTTTLTALFSEEPLPGAEWLVLVDGVDEILNPQLRSMVLAKVSRHRNEGRYRFLLTTRPLSDYLMERVTEDGMYPNFAIEPFGHHELGDFAANWFAQLKLADPQASAAEFVRRADEARLGQLAGIPLIATMMCILYVNAPEQQLPGNRAELYTEFVDLLLSKRNVINVRDLLADWTGRSGPEAVSAGEDLIQRTPELLKLLAYEEHRAGTDPFARDRRPDSTIIVAQHVPKPATVSSAEWDRVIREVLRSSGLLIERRGVFTFIHQTVQEYLAAAYLAAKHPNPQRRLARKQIIPQEWPWHDLEVKSFLVALWAKHDRDVTPVLARLLKRRNRAENYGFVLELHKQGIVLPQKVNAKLAEILAGWLGDDGLAHVEWHAAAAALGEIDSQRAATILLETSKIAINWQRRLDSSLLLLERSAPLGIQALEFLATDYTLGGAERLKAAISLYEWHPERGMAALARLAVDARPDNLRVEAARIVAEHDALRGQELLRAVAYDRATSDTTKLSAGRILGEGAGSDALAWLSSQRNVDSRVRLDAAIAVEAWRVGTGTSLMLALSLDLKVKTSVRMDAAELLGRAEDRRAILALKSIATTDGIDSAARAVAAERVASLDVAAGLALQLDLVADPALGDDRIAIGLSAGRISPERAAAALAKLVGVADVDPGGWAWRSEADSKLWIQAGLTAAHLDRETGLSALEGLVVGAHPMKIRLKAATAIAEIDLDHGIQLLQVLAEDTFVDDWARLEAAEHIWRLDKDLGGDVILTVGLNRRINTGLRIEFGRRIGKGNSTLGMKILRQIAMDTDVTPPQRLDAARNARGVDFDEGGRLETTVAADSVVSEYLSRLKRDKK